MFRKLFYVSLEVSLVFLSCHYEKKYQEVKLEVRQEPPVRRWVCCVPSRSSLMERQTVYSTEAMRLPNRRIYSYHNNHIWRSHDNVGTQLDEREYIELILNSSLDAEEVIAELEPYKKAVATQLADGCMPKGVVHGSP